MVEDFGLLEGVLIAVLINGAEGLMRQEREGRDHLLDEDEGEIKEPHREIGFSFCVLKCPWFGSC